MIIMDCRSGGRLSCRERVMAMYFHQLIDGFQLQMKEYQVQISQLEQLLVSSNTAPLAPQELTTLLHRLHETFVSIAARIHTIHETVQRHKENLTMYRRSGSVIYTKSHQLSAPLSTIGPSPFTAATNTYTLASSSQHFGEVEWSCRNFEILRAVCAGALSWWRIHDLLLHSSGRFCLIASLNHLKTPRLYEFQEFRLLKLFYDKQRPLPKVLFSASNGPLEALSTVSQLPKPSEGSQLIDLSKGPSAPLTVTTPTGEQKPFQLKPPPSNKRNKRWTSS
ncbi:NUPL1 [Cordylochernes scorpioides]|uniref:NUPL1 n=1 Tax=Cordylochernes scorpioides TaxID=51811 RepID=A0ABY6KAJ9_9ARAC|nr:NUPL1 [Cordylochernes scorpioides]